MNIDMTWVWIIVIGSLSLFQTNFTEIKTTWEVSYMLHTDNGSKMEIVVLTKPGRTLTHSLARSWIEDKEHAKAVILAVNKTRDKRVFMPFWSKSS